MVDIRKVIIIFVIGILFAVLVFAIIDAVYPQPEYNDYCVGQNYKPMPTRVENVQCENIVPEQSAVDECNSKKGYIEYDYDANGCPTTYKCETCGVEYENARKQHDVVGFYISAAMALLAIFIGLYLPSRIDSLNEWVGTGFMLGGTFALFFGTIQSYGSLDRIIRPIVLIFELGLIIFIAYKKTGNLRKDKKESKS